MKRNWSLKAFGLLALLAVLTFGMAAPAQAFSPRSGETVVIEEGEVINDDLYVGANSLIVRGTIKGDLIAGGNLIRIDPSGVVEGDLIAAGQGVVIAGRVDGDVRIAGYSLVIQDGAEVGEDVLAFGYSVDVQTGSLIGRDAVLGAGVASLSGEIDGNVNAGVTGLELNGWIGGDVSAEVGGHVDTTFTPMMFQIQPGVPAPIQVAGGLRVGPLAEIDGNLSYRAPEPAVIEGAVAGETVHSLPAVPEDDGKPVEPAEPTLVDRILDWVVNFLQDLTALLVIGFITAAFFPGVLREAADTLQSQPLPSFLWGIAVYLGFFVLVSLLILVVIFAAVFLGIITLGNLVWTVLGVGALGFTGVTVSFHLAVSFLSKIVVGYLIGRWLIGLVSPSGRESRFWPAVIGILVVAGLAAIPFVGWIINLFIVLFGLGALALLVRSRMPRTDRPAPAANLQSA